MSDAMGPIKSSGWTMPSLAQRCARAEERCVKLKAEVERLTKKNAALEAINQDNLRRAEELQREIENMEYESD